MGRLKRSINYKENFMPALQGSIQLPTDTPEASPQTELCRSFRFEKTASLFKNAVPTNQQTN